MKNPQKTRSLTPLISFQRSVAFSPKPVFDRSSLSINALRACVYIYIRQLSSFRMPTLWFIDLTVATCHIHHTFLSLRQIFFTSKWTKHKKTGSLPFSRKWPTQVTRSEILTFSFSNSCFGSQFLFSRYNEAEIIQKA